MSDKQKIFTCRILLTTLCTVLSLPSARAAELLQTLRPATGMLLVAAPEMRDPRFRQTVILLVEHSTDGSLGLIVNKATEVAVNNVFPELDDLSAGHVLYFGGPVQPERLAYLHRGKPQTGDHRIFDGVYWGSGSEQMKKHLQEKNEDAVRTFFGYAGWGPGQLEFELSLEDWLLSPANADHVFSNDVRHLWPLLNGERAGVMARSTGEGTGVAGSSNWPGLAL